MLRGDESNFFEFGAQDERSPVLSLDSTIDEPSQIAALRDARLDVAFVPGLESNDVVILVVHDIKETACGI